MQLYYAKTPNPWKACAVARHLDLEVDYRPVDLAKGENRTPAYLAINPNGKVPALVDGDLRLWESDAIMIHFATRAGSDLWPGDAAGQVEAARWLSWNACHFSRHAGTLFFENLIKPNFGFGDPDPRAVDEATTFFRQFAKVLDGHLGGRRHVLGDRLSVVDFALASMLPNAAAAKIPLGDFPEASRWFAGMMDLPACRDPFPA